MKEQGAPSMPPPGTALSVRQRRVWRSVFFFILFSVPLVTTLTFHHLAALIGDTLAAYRFWSSIVVAGFACGLIVARLNGRTRLAFIGNTLVFGAAYTLLEFLLYIACGFTESWIRNFAARL
jgi:hypothetical protein